LRNPSIMTWRFAWVHFAVDLYQSFSNYYRPVQMISYMMDFSLWRFDPVGYHLTNVILHILVSLSVYFFFKVITRDPRIAFFGALIYALHPAHTSAVTYIAGRADPLAALFSLLSVILFHFHFKAKKDPVSIFLYIASLVAFLSALLSKEITVVLPAIIFIYGLFFIGKEEVKRSRGLVRFHYISPFLIILGVYVILRITALDFQQGALIARHPLYLRSITAIRVISAYFGIIFMPARLHMERDIPCAATFFDSAILISASFIIFIIWGALKIRKISRPAFFGIIFFFVSLAPILNIYQLPNNMAEHWLYIPMIGISLSLSCLALMLWEKRVKARPFLALILVFYIVFFSARTFVRNADWRDEFTIYTHTYKNNPKSIKILNNLGNLYNASGDFAKAAEFHKKALEVDPREYKTLLNLGIDYQELGMLDEAFAQYESSARSNPNYAKAYFHMGSIHVKKGDLDKAINAYLHAIELDPFFAASHANMGNTYFKKGDYKKAREEYEKAIEISPYLADLHNNRGSALTRLGIYDEAVEAYKKAIAINPDDWEYHLNLGAIYGELGIFDEALSELKRAHQLNPGNIDTLINLGLTHYYGGSRSLAKKEWEKILRLDPANVTALSYLKGAALP